MIALKKQTKLMQMRLLASNWEKKMSDSNYSHKNPIPWILLWRAYQGNPAGSIAVEGRKEWAREATGSLSHSFFWPLPRATLRVVAVLYCSTAQS